MPTEAQLEEAEGYYKAYEGHTNILRTWLVAYGIGAPVLYMTNSTLQVRVAESPNAKVVALLFLGGVFLQISIATINKFVMWGAHKGLLDESFQAGCNYRIAKSLKDRIGIDLCVDVLTILLFILATYLLYDA